jgi:hypothetical protein
MKPTKEELIEKIMEEAEIEMYDNGDSSANDMGNLRNILAKHLQNLTTLKQSKSDTVDEELVEKLSAEINMKIHYNT